MDTEYYTFFLFDIRFYSERISERQKDRQFDDGTMLFALWPGDHLDSGDLGPLSEVDHPSRSVDVEVIEHRAAVHADCRVAVDGARRVSAHPLSSHVPLVLAPVVDPRALLESHVLHCTHTRARANYSAADDLNPVSIASAISDTPCRPTRDRAAQFTTSYTGALVAVW